MKTSKRYLSTLLSIAFLLSIVCFPTNVSAASQAETCIDSDFLATASVNLTTDEDGFTEITLTNQEELQSAVFSTINSRSYRTTTLAFFAETLDERAAILSRINQTKAGGGTIYDEDWFFGSSCYAYISITYTTRDVYNGTEARINSVTTRHSTNSGTSVSNAVLHLACIGSSSDEGSTYLERDVIVTTSPYTNTLMNTWPWINTGSPCLGANYTVTARRPSGSTSTHTVSANAFVN